jgi:RecA/RadA recombinase
MSDDEIIAESADIPMDDVRKLYEEFYTFIEDKTGLKRDVGVKETIPTGIRVLDTILGGGFAVGNFHSIVGNPGCGKSTLGIQALAGAQKQYKGQLLAGFLDSEQATTTVRMANLGVTWPKMKPIVDVTIEDVFKFIGSLCLYNEKTGLPGIVVWDSIANTITMKDKEIDDPNSTTGWKARLLSALIPKTIPRLGAHNICFIAINQYRDKLKMGNFTPPKDMQFSRADKSMPGGWAIKYNAMQLIDMKVNKTLTLEDDGLQGIQAELVCVKNKIFSPNIEINILGDFVKGFNDFWTSYSFLAEHNRIAKAGSYVHLINRPKMNFYRKNAETMYKTDPDFKEAFDEAVDDTLKTELIDKNNPNID